MKVCCVIPELKSIWILKHPTKEMIDENIKMTVILFVFLLVSNLICYLSGRRYKWLWLLTVVFLGVVFVFASYKTGDRLEYYYFYNSIDELSQSKFEIGYGVLNIVIKSLGFSFSGFLLAIYIICSSLIWSSAKKIGVNENLTVFLYGLYLIIYFCIAIRFFIALSFIVFGLSFLVERKRIAFLISIIIAVFFHSSAMIYVPLVFMNKLKKVEKSYLIPGIAILLTGIILINKDAISFVLSRINIIFPWLEYRANIYIRDNQAGYGLLLFLLYPILGYLCTYIWNKMCKKKNYNLKETQFFYWLYIIGLLNLYTMPLIVMDGDFVRVSMGSEFMIFMGVSIIHPKYYLRDNYKNGIQLRITTSIDSFVISMLVIVGIVSFYILSLNSISVLTILNNMSFERLI